MTTYSHSRLATYEQCHLKFKFRYIDKIAVEIEESIESFMGDKVHKALEWLYRQVRMGKVPAAKQVVEQYGEDWKKNFHKQIKINEDGFSAMDYFNKGRGFIENYYRNYHPFDENTIATEKRVLINLDKSGKYLLQGFIDRLVYNEESEAYEIHDYKTNKALKTQGDLDQDRQLALYSIAIKSMYPDARKICLIWHFLAFNKEFCSFRTDEQLEELKKGTIGIIKEIESCKEWPANETPLCSWCEFRQHCPRFKHLYLKDKGKDDGNDKDNDNEKGKANKYLLAEGEKLVNKYSELYQKKKEILDEIESELELLKEAIVEYARKNGVEVLFGTEKKISIKITDRFKLPSKRTKERQELEGLLKKLEKWDEISTLDTFALEHVIKEGAWPKEILKKVKSFGKFEESARLSISKRKDLEE